jgi:hypothetical protein
MLSTIKTCVVVFLLGAALSAQTCPLVPVRLLAKHEGACVRTVGVVTFIRRGDGFFYVHLADKRGNLLRAKMPTEPYINEVIEVWGTLSKSDMLDVDSSRTVTIKKLHSTPKP